MNLSRTDEKDFYKRHTDNVTTKVYTITFKFPEESEFIQEAHDWYLTAALEKADNVPKDRHLLTRELLLQFRGAIREAYQHQLDFSMKRQYNHPNCRNTIQAIRNYIERIRK